MKRILVPVLLVFALTACGTTGPRPESETPDRTEVTEQSVDKAQEGMIGAEFNPVEYLLFAQIEATARVAQAYCGSVDELLPRLQKIEEITEVLVTHAAYLPNNTETTEIARILRNNIQEFLARYNIEADRQAYPSETYCERKLELYIKGIRRALEAVGQKVRRR